MEKYCVLISGLTIAIDKKLGDELQKSAVVLKNQDNPQIESITTDKKVDLILLEISKANPSEVEIIKTIKSRHPRIEILLVDGDGDREVIARAFEYGAKDAFRKPYKRALIVERVRALIRKEVNKIFDIIFSMFFHVIFVAKFFTIH